MQGAVPVGRPGSRCPHPVAGSQPTCCSGGPAGSRGSHSLCPSLPSPRQSAGGGSALPWASGLPSAPSFAGTPFLSSPRRKFPGGGGAISHPLSWGSSPARAPPGPRVCGLLGCPRGSPDSLGQGLTASLSLPCLRWPGPGRCPPELKPCLPLRNAELSPQGSLQPLACLDFLLLQEALWAPRSWVGWLYPDQHPGQQTLGLPPPPSSASAYRRAQERDCGVRPHWLQPSLLPDSAGTTRGPFLPRRPPLPVPLQPHPLQALPHPHPPRLL